MLDPGRESKRVRERGKPGLAGDVHTQYILFIAKERHLRVEFI